MKERVNAITHYRMTLALIRGITCPVMDAEVVKKARSVKRVEAGSKSMRKLPLRRNLISLIRYGREPDRRTGQDDKALRE